MSMRSKKAGQGGLVYSSEQGRMCPACSQPVANCRCKANPPAASKVDGIVRVGRVTKGRKGSGVTVITGLPLGPEELREMAGRLKKLCGAGGGLKDGVIEIQGEHRDQLVALLQQQGYTVKRVGG